MSLRTRQKAATSQPEAAGDQQAVHDQGSERDIKEESPQMGSKETSVLKPSTAGNNGEGASKKLPRVILKLGRDPRESAAP